jgi:predicted nucleic acid-binding protein
VIAPSAGATGILDANAIIGLAKSNCFGLLPQLFALVLVPPLVVSEVTDPPSRAALQAALAVWLVEKPPSAVALGQLPTSGPPADRQVLALAWDNKPSFILTGDRWFLHRAAALHVAAISPPRVIQLIAEAGLIDAARPHLDRMREAGFGITDEEYEAILRTLGEL